MLSDLRLAFRNCLRHRRRSAIAVVVIAFGVAALVVAGGFVDWTLQFGREATIRSRLGHIQVVRPGYLDAGASRPDAYLLPATSDSLVDIERQPEVLAVGPRLAFNGLISKGDTTISFLGEGVAPGAEALISSSIAITAGSRLEASDPKGVMLGEGLAANMGVGVGDKVVLMATTRTGSVNAVECHVRGAFRTISKAYDDAALRLPIATARELLRVEGAHAWVILLSETAQTSPVLSRLQGLHRDANLEFVPWTHLADFHNKTSTLFAQQMGFIQFIVGAIIVLAVANSLTMIVIERTGEIGTLLAIGVRRVQVLTQFVLEGTTLGILGGAIGVALGLGAAYAISLIGIPMPAPPGMSHGYVAKILVNPPLVGRALAIAAVPAMLASAYPAWKASRLPIVDALRRNR